MSYGGNKLMRLIGNTKIGKESYLELYHYSNKNYNNILYTTTEKIEVIKMFTTKCTDINIKNFDTIEIQNVNKYNKK
jgi:hypothetical protein